MKKFGEFNNKYVIILSVFMLGIAMMVFTSNAPNHEKSYDFNSHLDLENKITEMLKSTYGFDEVSVILTFDTTGEKIYEPGEDSDIITQNNNLVKSEKLPYVRGALIAVNSIDIETCEHIKEAIAILLGISKEKVSVIYN